LGRLPRRWPAKIAVTPGGTYSSSTAAGVSGNEGPKLLWTGDIVTPTEDPDAVVHEVLNEIVGRL
jgi:hypothetical protein